MNCCRCGGYSPPERYAVQRSRSDDGRSHSAPRAAYRSRNSTHPLQSAGEKSHRAPCETNSPGREQHRPGSPYSAEPEVCLPQSSSSLFDALSIALNCQSFVDFPRSLRTRSVLLTGALPHGLRRVVALSGPFPTALRPASLLSSSEFLTRNAFCETSLREVTERRLLRNNKLSFQ